MDKKCLYEETINVLLDLLKGTITDFSAAHDTACEHYHSQPLFSITSSKLALLKNISHFSNYQVRNEMADLCCKLYPADRLEKDTEFAVKNVDFIGMCDGIKTGYCVSMVEEYMPDIADAKKSGIEKLVVIVLKSGLFNLPPNNTKYRAYEYKNIIQNITLEEYFDSITPGEYEVFQEYIGRFNYEAEILLGLTISPIPTKNALEEKREKIKGNFLTGFFEECLNVYFDENETKVLKDRFFNTPFSQIPNGDYTDSLISSEWYYDLFVSTDGEMEQTAIVAGYLKSIEQFLFSMMLSKCDKLHFKLRVKKANKDDDKYIPLTTDNYSKLLTMAGSLLTSIDINYGKKLDQVYLNEDIGRKTQQFLHNYFEHTRNGYFHKDNIYTWNEIEGIRKETYGAYFLIASSFA